MIKTVVVGGGAAGIIAAIKASETDEVILLEKNERIGKKITLTGNGRCNYWNSVINLDKYCTDDSDILNQIITEENQKIVFDFLSSLGILFKEKKGCCYPYSLEASSVRDVFENAIKRRNIKVICNYEVTDVVHDKDSFLINNDILCDKLIITTGSKAIPKTGSTGYGYFLAEKFGLKVNEVLPALVQLRANEKYLHLWNGVRVDGSVCLVVDGNLIKTEEGEMQLTDYGISGICVFNLSGLVAKSLAQNKKVKLLLNFLADQDDVKKLIEKRNINLGNPEISELFVSVINYKLINIVLTQAKINPHAHLKSLTSSEFDSLIKALTAFEIEIVATNGFDKSQVCTGGVSIKEINPKTMETLKIKNLHLAGELLDVDGICGGYNLAFAFISGYIAGTKNDNN